MPVPRRVVNVRSKGRCESASAVRPAAFHASSQVGFGADLAQSSRDTSSPPKGKSVVLVQSVLNHPIYYVLVCRVALGHYVRTRDAAPKCKSIDGAGAKSAGAEPCFARDNPRELAAVPNVSPPIHF